MLTRRKLLAGLGLGAFAPAFPLLAQQDKVRRIGYLALRSRSTLSNPEPFYDAFVQGMRELGYIEGKNLVIEWRFADGKSDRVPGFAAELVRMKLEIIVTHANIATEALQRATSTIPIVSVPITEPVERGFAASLARPGGNITGLSLMAVDLSPKQLELLKTVMPAFSHVAVLVNPDNPGHPTVLKTIQATARQFGIKVLPVNARTAEEIEHGFSLMTRERANAGISMSDPFFTGQRRQIAQLASQHRLPMMYGQREYVEAGGLMSYGANIADIYRRGAVYVDKILKGAKPSELPIEQPTKIHLAINRKTAKALGLTIPQELLLRADEVIE